MTILKDGRVIKSRVLGLPVEYSVDWSEKIYCLFIHTMTVLGRKICPVKLGIHSAFHCSYRVTSVFFMRLP